MIVIIMNDHNEDGSGKKRKSNRDARLMTIQMKCSEVHKRNKNNSNVSHTCLSMAIFFFWSGMGIFIEVKEEQSRETT